MASPDVLQREEGLLYSSPLLDPKKAGESTKSRGMSIEKKIEFLESLTGKVIIFLFLSVLAKVISVNKFEGFEFILELISHTLQVSNRRSRRWLNDRLLMELVPRLDAEEIRGLFAPPPWAETCPILPNTCYNVEFGLDLIGTEGDEVPPSAFSMTNCGEWDKFRNIDMDKEANIITTLNSSSLKRKGHVNAEKIAVLNAWHRVDCRTREALRRSFLSELIEGYEDCIRAFIKESGDGDVLVLKVQDSFHRLLLHGVCEFYNLVSITVTESKDSESMKMTKIKKKKRVSPELPNITLSHFLKMSKEGIW
ncbi:hypothetical protein Patl1_03420 [Pistacia atlantica]|uniref:Uncharacterized protein n=1 Tax=Pistacia atlantica TaxID=434234 RepID=A0ACC1C6M9_9ROSI|nr:hypothetical protein Patl1_03420 [Pistacia atlantica]